MKLYVIVCFLVFFCASREACAQELSEMVRFEERVYDFGAISEEKGKVSHEFVFYNQGSVPVVIDDVYSGCGCVGKNLSKDPVKPGNRGKLTITFNPDYKSGFFSKEIVVYSQGRRYYNRIWVQGTVKPRVHPVEDEYPYNFGNGLHLRLKVMAFGYMKPGETRRMELHYANDTDKPLSLYFLNRDKGTGLEFANPGILKAGERGVLHISFKMPYVTGNEVLYTLIPVVNNQQLHELLHVKALKDNVSRLTSPLKSGVWGPFTPW